MSRANVYTHPWFLAFAIWAGCLLAVVFVLAACEPELGDCPGLETEPEEYPGTYNEVTDVWSSECLTGDYPYSCAAYCYEVGKLECAYEDLHSMTLYEDGNGPTCTDVEAVNVTCNYPIAKVSDHGWDLTAVRCHCAGEPVSPG